MPQQDRQGVSQTTNPNKSIENENEKKNDVVMSKPEKFKQPLRAKLNDLRSKRAWKRSLIDRKRPRMRKDVGCF